jgi:hypothetical protein
LSGTGGMSAERWRHNWRSVSGGDALRVELSHSRAERRARLAAIRELASGSRVVITASAPRAAGRCRAFASEAGLELEREYLAFPSAGAPAYLVQDEPAPVRLFVSNVLVRLLAPGRVVVGRRT